MGIIFSYYTETITYIIPIKFTTNWSEYRSPITGPEGKDAIADDTTIKDVIDGNPSILK